MAQVSFSFVSNSLLYNMHITWPPNKGKYNLNHNIQQEAVNFANLCVADWPEITNFPEKD